jgi:hypothetical protein
MQCFLNKKVFFVLYPLTASVLSKNHGHVVCHFLFPSIKEKFKSSIKKIVSRDDYFVKVYNNKQELSVHALIVFRFFCFSLKKP